MTMLNEDTDLELIFDEEFDETISCELHDTVPATWRLIFRFCQPGCVHLVCNVCAFSVKRVLDEKHAGNEQHIECLVHHVERVFSTGEGLVEFVKL